MFYETHVPTTAAVRSVFYKAYAWMATGLAITGITSWFVFANPVIFSLLISTKILFYGFFFAQIALVWAIGGMIERISFPAAFGMFSLYAVLLGITLSTIFAVFTYSSIAIVFAIASAMFAYCALFGYFTKSDLSSMGSMLNMALFGIIIAMLLNWFFASPAFDYIISLIGVVVFAGLAAYDTQKIKQFAFYSAQDASSETQNKVALISALELYLDFINMFLFLLRLFGRRK